MLRLAHSWPSKASFCVVTPHPRYPKDSIIFVPCLGDQKEVFLVLIINKEFNGRLRSLSRSFKADNIETNTPGIFQESLLGVKSVSKGFMRGSGVNNHGIYNIKNRSCVKGVVGVGQIYGDSDGQAGVTCVAYKVLSSF